MIFLTPCFFRSFVNLISQKLRLSTEAALGAKKLHYENRTTTGSRCMHSWNSAARKVFVNVCNNVWFDQSCNFNVMSEWRSNLRAYKSDELYFGEVLVLQNIQCGLVKLTKQEQHAPSAENQHGDASKGSRRTRFDIFEYGKKKVAERLFSHTLNFANENTICISTHGYEKKNCDTVILLLPSLVPLIFLTLLQERNLVFLKNKAVLAVEGIFNFYTS